MGNPSEPDDLHVELSDDGWVIRTADRSVTLATYQTQRAAWVFAQTRSQIEKVDAFLHTREGLVRDQVTHRRAVPSFKKALFAPPTLWMLAVLVVIGILFLRPTSESETSDSRGYETVAQGLAVIDEGGFVAPDDPMVSSYQDALIELRSSVCFVPEEQIADMAVSARENLMSEGVPATVLQILIEAKRGLLTRICARFRVVPCPPGSAAVTA